MKLYSIYIGTGRDLHNRPLSRKWANREISHLLHSGASTFGGISIDRLQGSYQYHSGPARGVTVTEPSIRVEVISGEREKVMEWKEKARKEMRQESVMVVSQNVREEK